MSETAVEELNPVAAGDDVEHQYLEKEKVVLKYKSKTFVGSIISAPT